MATRPLSKIGYGIRPLPNTQQNKTEIETETQSDRRLAIFSLILITLGLLAGLILGNKSQEKEEKPRKVVAK